MTKDLADNSPARRNAVDGQAIPQSTAENQGGSGASVNPMVEKVARAICRNFVVVDYEGDEIDGLVDLLWDEHIEDARAAMKAMLDPTDDVLLALQHAAGSFPAPVFIGGAEGVWTWSSGLAACLGQPLEPSGRKFSPVALPAVCRAWIDEAVGASDAALAEAPRP